MSTKGRDKTLIKNRNHRLVARFYFYSHLVGLKFEKTLEHLETEFELSQARICDLLSENSTNATYLQQKQITTTQLKEAYPFMTWSYAPATRLQNANQLHLNLF